jgi:nitrite reductase (NADH) small subunit
MKTNDAIDMSTQVDGNWIDVCALEDIPRLGARRVRRTDGVDIALFRTASDAVFALLDRCPHKGGPLSQGIVFGDRVACPLHNWTIELATGQALAPDEGCATRFAVKVDGGRVLLEARALAMPAELAA